MRSEILEKLNKELSDLPIDTEPRAMYLLVQIRKIMDHLEDGDNPLRFYCNWVVHIVLKRSAAQEKLNTLVKMLVDTPIENSTGAISFFALQKRSESPVGGAERVEYRMVRNGNEILGNIYQ